eukprot:TRINITY_DN835_c0_g1_i1.p6 TRINITY_DN835_c0_g1~~TRINITY_DN835_c0_g1_i1.p6  ORF type:complete len:128 (-),score=9.26 TRINITY_DN835_c0_g1_i1:485-868(-)
MNISQKTGTHQASFSKEYQKIKKNLGTLDNMAQNRMNIILTILMNQFTCSITTELLQSVYSTHNEKIEDDPLTKQLYLEIEQEIRKLIAERQSTKKLDLYRGSPLLWQVVDDDIYGKGKVCKRDNKR